MKKFLSSLMLLKCINSLSDTINTNTTLYYSNVQRGDSVNVNTKDWGKFAPLQGFGAYLNNREYFLDNAVINVSGIQADAIRTNGGNNVLYSNTLKIEATGLSGDAINMASSNYNSKHIDLLYVRDYAELSSKYGVTVRANNYYNEDSKSIIILPNNSIIKNTSTSANNISDSTGYAVYAGNRDKDNNNGTDINAKGRSYVFIGDNSKIESSAKKGHTVYANKGGLVQLGDKAEILATGENGYALFASTEQQSGYTDNIRPGKFI